MTPTIYTGRAKLTSAIQREIIYQMQKGSYLQVGIMNGKVWLCDKASSKPIKGATFDALFKRGLIMNANMGNTWTLTELGKTINL
jgi:hypothetical protein